MCDKNYTSKEDNQMQAQTSQEGDVYFKVQASHFC